MSERRVTDLDVSDLSQGELAEVIDFVARVRSRRESGERTANDAPYGLDVRALPRADGSRPRYGVGFLDSAPLDDEPFTDEDRELVRAGRDDIALTGGHSLDEAFED